MFVLFKEWSKSLNVFSFDNIGSFLSAFITNFFKAIKFFLQYFGWVFLFDVCLFMYMGDLILKVPKILYDPTKTVNTAALLLHLVTSVIWFVLSTAFLLSIRRRSIDKGYHYFKIGFLRYIQLALVFSLVFLLFINLLIGLGITAFPKFHWSLIVLARFIELLTIFYWLDSTFRLKDILYSLENALNLFLYNVPFFAILFAFWWLFKLGLSFVISWFGLTFDFSQILSGVSKSQLLPLSANSFTIFAAIKILAAKYLFFFGDYFIIAFIFAFYAIKREENYTPSLFDKSDNLGGV